MQIYTNFYYSLYFSFLVYFFSYTPTHLNIENFLLFRSFFKKTNHINTSKVHQLVISSITPFINPEPSHEKLKFCLKFFYDLVNLPQRRGGDFSMPFVNSLTGLKSMVWKSSTLQGNPVSCWSESLFRLCFFGLLYSWLG